MNETARRNAISAAQPVAHGPYSLVMSLMTGELIIQRQDADHKRTVATIGTLPQWDRFVAALEDGADDVAAVHSIDSPLCGHGVPIHGRTCDGCDAGNAASDAAL